MRCVCFLLGLLIAAVSAEFLIGVGKADITGPAAQTVALGYGRSEQVLNGIHTRLWARAFLVAHPTINKQHAFSLHPASHQLLPRKRILFVSIEACMASQAVTSEVLRHLKERYGETYHEGNVAITPTHTHSAPGGYLQYFLYSLATAGFLRDTLDAHVQGILEAVHMAHSRAQLGRLELSKGELLDASINRSPTAYLQNPAAERAQFEHDTNKMMTQLKFTTASNREIGLLNWFAVHGTSLNHHVRLISGDNKGVASQLFEKYKLRQRGVQFTGNVSSDGFVAAFAQSNSGDVSPNTAGAYCRDNGEPCDLQSSTCHGRCELCEGRGPGWPDCFKSSTLIGQKQFEKAKSLYEDTERAQELTGEIQFASVFLNVSAALGETEDGYGTCRPAMGYSFAAGTTDGPGMFDFVQGKLGHSLFWDTLGGFVHRVSPKQKACQAPKPILLDTGEMERPIPWQPEVLQLQILRVGSFVLVCVPGEVTTMAGRRLEAAVAAEVKDAWGPDLEIVISGLANDYSSYITTYEEYQIQRYEGASTIFGPHTLEAYIKEFRQLAHDMVHGVERRSEIQPPNYLDKQWSFKLPVILDSVPPTLHFGRVHADRDHYCYSPHQTVHVTFWSANPTNSLGVRGHTFLTVERYDPLMRLWIPVASDDDLETKFAWKPCLGSRLMPCSKAHISWSIEANVDVGMYRIGHFGHAKQNLFTSTLTPFAGYSDTFLVQPSCENAVITV